MADFYFGDMAYLPLDTGSLAILDISNPNAVTILGSLDLGFRAVNVAVKDDIVYVSSLKKTKIIDTSDPKNLIYTGDLEPHMMNPTVMKTIVHGSYMYVAYDRNGTSVGGIAIYDVSIPESPQIISYLLFGSTVRILLCMVIMLTSRLLLKELKSFNSVSDCP